MNKNAVLAEELGKGVAHKLRALINNHDLRKPAHVYPEPHNKASGVKGTGVFRKDDDHLTRTPADHVKERGLIGGVRVVKMIQAQHMVKLEHFPSRCRSRQSGFNHRLAHRALEMELGPFDDFRFSSGVTKDSEKSVPGNMAKVAMNPEDLPT